MNRLLVFVCHAASDRPLAGELAAFLERGANVEVCVDDGRVGPGETLVSKAAEGLQADVILLILSPDSLPSRPAREQWVPAFCDEPQRAGVKVGAVLARPCPFPELLRRRNFFDLTEHRLEGFRAVKRWLLSLRPPPEELFFAPAGLPRFIGREAEIETLRRWLGDCPGVSVLRSASPGFGKTALAIEFARRSRGDFEGVFWLNCGCRSAAGLAGDLAVQLGLRLEYDTAANQQELRSFCSQRRCLIVLDDARGDTALPLIPGGKASLLITTESRDLADSVPSGAMAGGLMESRLIDVGAFTEQEALSLFPQVPEARRLVAELGAAPLACAVAAGLLSADPQCSIEALAEALAGTPGTEPQRRLLQLAIAATGESGQRLLTAMSACAPDGFLAALAEKIAGFQPAAAREQIQDLLSRSLLANLDPARGRYCLHPLVREVLGAGPARRHAEVLCGEPVGEALACLPDLERALAWSLSEQDPEAWSLACALSSRVLAMTRDTGRLAEADELLRTLLPAAHQRHQDRRAIENWAWEWKWILEKWDRLDEARQLEQYRRAIRQDQTCFDFMLELAAGAG